MDDKSAEPTAKSNVPATRPQRKVVDVASIPPNLRKESLKPKPRVSQVVSATETHSGPLPRPTDLQGYELVLPGAAQRIMIMAEKEQENRNLYKNKALDLVGSSLKQKYTLATRGQYFAFAIFLIYIAIAVWLFSIDKDIFAVGLGSLGLITLAVAYLKMERPKSSEVIDEEELDK